MMLAVAIAFSQARRPASPGTGWLQRRAFPLAKVLVSYCLMKRRVIDSKLTVGVGRRPEIRDAVGRAAGAVYGPTD